MTRILVVEDDPSIRLGLEDTLRAKGYDVDVTSRGEDGAERAASGRYDLVVLDIMLPDIDGFEVCRRIRAGRGAGGADPGDHPVGARAPSSTGSAASRSAPTTTSPSRSR